MAGSDFYAPRDLVLFTQSSVDPSSVLRTSKMLRKGRRARYVEVCVKMSDSFSEAVLVIEHEGERQFILAHIIDDELQALCDRWHAALVHQMEQEQVAALLMIDQALRRKYVRGRLTLVS